MIPRRVARYGPVISSIYPSSGSTSGGTSVTITGRFFLGTTAVSIGGINLSPLNVVSDTSITGTTGPHSSGAVSVAVTTPVLTTAISGLYTYTAPPVTVTVTSASPSSGGIYPQGLTIYGSGFQVYGNATSVGFNYYPYGTHVVSVDSVINDGQLTCTTPDFSGDGFPPGDWSGSIQVNVPGGSGSAYGIYTVSVGA